MVLQPNWHDGTWMFDDPAKALNREPCVRGILDMISEMVREIPDARQGSRLLFLTRPFLGHTHRLEQRREESGGKTGITLPSSKPKAGFAQPCSSTLRAHRWSCIRKLKGRERGVLHAKEKQALHPHEVLDWSCGLAPMDINVLFLDIGGVLNPDKQKHHHLFLPECVGRLRRIFGAQPSGALCVH